MDISSDGTIVTIGLPKNDGNKNNAGSLRVYICNNLDSHWVQHGMDLDGESQYDQLGSNISMLADRIVTKSNEENTKQLKIVKWITC